MKELHLVSMAEQVAAHLREEILWGGLLGEMPGAKSLAATLGINHKTVDAAALLLERDGFLRTQGPGKPRLIVLPDKSRAPALRVAILLYEPNDQRVHFMVDLQHSLARAGHTSTLATKTLSELHMDPRRVARLVDRTKADAWIVQAGSREVLEWFAKQPFPAFALFGNLGPVPLPRAAPATGPAIINAVQRLLDLGHRRIVMLAHRERRLPAPGFSEQLFLDQLKAHGIPPSDYNLPDWDDTPKGLQSKLDSLFQLTPPTALITGDVLLHFPVQLYLARRGILAPEQVSLVCADFDPRFHWCQPTIAHIRWNHRRVISRVINWANNVSHGKEDLRKTTTKAEFVEGGTVGPAPRES
jgi:DNA-binding LacI/PurR family transcriptional regulator